MRRVISFELLATRRAPPLHGQPLSRLSHAGVFLLVGCVDERNDRMLIQPIDVFVYAWLIVAVLSAAYVAWDQFTGNPEAAVMKWGFVLVTLYMGQIGLLLYVMADK
jgi:hypothetical protein